MSKRSRHSGPTVNINDLVQALRQYNQNPQGGAGPQTGGPMGNMNLGSLAGLLGGQGGGMGMPQMPGMGQGMPQIPGMGQGGMPQIPGMGQGGMPQIPGMGQGMPQIPGMGMGIPQMPGMGQGMPQMPGMGMGMPQMPGMGQGMPGISQMTPASASAGPPAQGAKKSEDKKLLQTLFEQILLALKER